MPCPVSTLTTSSNRSLFILSSRSRCLFALVLASSVVGRCSQLQGRSFELPRHLQVNALPSNLPGASQEPSPASVDALLNTVITVTASFDNMGSGLGFAPFYELYLPVGADNQSCYEYLSADWCVLVDLLGLTS